MLELMLVITHISVSHAKDPLLDLVHTHNGGKIMLHSAMYTIHL